MSTQVKEQVKDYYGKELQSSKDLKTNACCTFIDFPDYIRDAMRMVHDEVQAKYYGCGLVIPYSVHGLKILDLGSGSGRDCYVLSKLVGENGEVVGVDMTDEQLAVANEYVHYHADKFGYKKPNTKFLKGEIEKLDELDLKPGSFDLIISNCVINLSTDKDAVLKSAFNLLKPGGEMYFSDVYSDRRIPEALVKDPVLYGECLSGALYWNDFLNKSRKAGFSDPRLVEAAPLLPSSSEVEAKVKGLNFTSRTYRLWKIEGIEPDCEDYGQAVKYKGNLGEAATHFRLDDGHIFEAGRIYPVCGNTYRMLNDTRFKENFEFFGDWNNHLGIYQDCGTTSLTSSEESTAVKGSCC